MLAASATYGLEATSGLIQSPYFLYRVEINALDNSNGRLKYDGVSMANRLSYLLTGRPPSAPCSMPQIRPARHRRRRPGRHCSLANEAGPTIA